MPGQNAENKASFLIPETGGFGVIADPSGATALFIPAEMDPATFAKNEAQIVQRNLATGRAMRSPHVNGVGRASVKQKIWMHGYDASEGGDGNPPPTQDALDYILEAFLGAPDTTAADVVAAGSTSSTLETVSDRPAAGELVAVRGTATNNGRVQFRRVSASASPYNVVPDWTDTPVSPDVVYATRTYRPRAQPGEMVSGLGDTYTLIFDNDGEHYAVPGVRPGGFSVSAEAGLGIFADVSHVGDSRIRQNFGSLPNPNPLNYDPIPYRLSPIIVDGTEYLVGKMQLDLRPELTPVKAGNQSNGRSDWRIKSCHAQLTIDPLDATVWEDLFDNGTIFNVLAQFGEGALTDGALRALAWFCEWAQVIEAPNEVNDGGVVRKQVKIAPADAVTPSINTYWVIGRV